MPAKKLNRVGSFPGIEIRKTGSASGPIRHFLPNGTEELKTLIATRTLTPAEIRALFATPISLIAAPGAGKAISIVEVIATNTFGVAAYTGANALELRYTDASGAKVTADIASTFINLAAGTQTNRVGGVASDLVMVANAAIVVRVPTADPGGGTATGTIRFIVHYRVTPA